ncbi:cellulase family glycosylhydrolase [Bacteroides ovatus]|nr:cellulase family glycosylhydrolase [Bacteroides ovatus]
MMNTIKRFNFVAVFPAFFFFCMIIACSDDERNPITPAVHIVAGTVDVPVEGQGEILLLTADAAVTVSSDASWCVISEKAEKGISYYATMAANVETTPREAKVTIKSDNIALGRVLVKQKPKTAGEPEIPSGSMESDAKTLAAKIYAGVNIGNTLEATGGETAWGNPRISEAYIKGLKALGFNAVRIPCAWNSHLSNETTNQIDAAWLNRVSEVVGYCVANNMYAILNIHWDGGWLEDHILGGYSEALNTKQKNPMDADCYQVE